MPRNLREWIALVSFAIGLAAALADWREVAALSLFVTIVFGVSAARTARLADRYRL